MNAGAVAESPFSFPSGHACFMFCFAVILFLWIKKDMKKSEAVLIFIIPIFVACSRIYLMIHYPSDVLFGCLEGIGLGIACWFLYKLWVKIINKMPDNIQKL